MNLYPYQQEGVLFLAQRRRAYLADGMGLGKTVQAAAAAKRLEVGAALIVCPASAVENWHREWKKWGPWGNIACISYSKILHNPDLVQGQDWGLVILDEAHYCKNRKAKRTLAALDVARNAPRAWLLSGTPMPNHPGELWAPIRALWPEIPRDLGLKTHWQWFNHFCRWTRTKYGPRPYGVRNSSDLVPHLKRIMLRRQVEDVALDLPPLRIDVSLLPRDAGFARALEEAGVDPERLEKRMSAEDGEEGSSSRLRRLLGEYKAPRIGEIIARELDDREYQQIVVLAYHRSVLDALRQKLEPFGVVGFDGSTPQKERQKAIDAFTDDPSNRVFLAQQSAAGIAINLQTASELVLVEPAWSPDENAQAIKRVHRIGSERPVRARVFAVAGSLDEAVMGTLAKKVRMQADLGLTDKGEKTWTPTRK